ncbi:DUF4112 domain-containing protein [Acidicapsa ligni]|uniref:DUF4112 domain-containing protein n=1 Tax=Acidicapsa ligni TaxID=542300 RepID=UPI0021DF5BD2|nr:DUF4112 domain-containing protein [Acidicapsa ligni]
MPSKEPIGELLPNNRWKNGGRWLGDERLRWLEVMLDEAFVIPGTGIRFGLDGIIGLVPGLGDVLAGILSLVIPLAAWVRGVPYITLLRMLVNLAIGVLGGTIPVLGDIFDVFWKANRRNYRLLTRSLDEPRKHTWRDWVFLALMAGAIGVIFAIPILLLFWFFVWLAEWKITR